MEEPSIPEVVPVVVPEPQRVKVKNTNFKKKTADYVVGGVLVAVGVIASAVLIADDATGIGVLDDPFLVGTIGMITKGVGLLIN